MKIDTGALDLRIGALINMAKRRNEMNYSDFEQYLTISEETFGKMRTKHKLHSLKACDLVMIEKLAGAKLDTTGLERR